MQAERFNEVKINLDSMTNDELENLRGHVVTRVEAAQGELAVLDEYMRERQIEGLVGSLVDEGVVNARTT